jgi:hypothetical protein
MLIDNSVAGIGDDITRTKSRRRRQRKLPSWSARSSIPCSRPTVALSHWGIFSAGIHRSQTRPSSCRPARRAKCWLGARTRSPALDLPWPDVGLRPTYHRAIHRNINESGVDPSGGPGVGAGEDIPGPWSSVPEKGCKTLVPYSFVYARRRPGRRWTFYHASGRPRLWLCSRPDTNRVNIEIGVSRRTDSAQKNARPSSVEYKTSTYTPTSRQKLKPGGWAEASENRAF